MTRNRANHQANRVLVAVVNGHLCCWFERIRESGSPYSLPSSTGLSIRGASSRLTVLAALLIDRLLPQQQRSVVIGIDLQRRRQFPLRSFVITQLQEYFARMDQA